MLQRNRHFYPHTSANLNCVGTSREKTQVSCTKVVLMELLYTLAFSLPIPFYKWLQ